MLYKLSTTIYLDKHHECYKRIFILDGMPNGPLAEYTKRITKHKLSPFDETNHCNSNCNSKCLFSVLDMDNKNDFLCIDDISKLFNFLKSNGYTIDSTFTKLMNKNNRLNNNDDFICFIHYP